jgi:hypothetical protein
MEDLSLRPLLALAVIGILAFTFVTGLVIGLAL